MDNTSKWFYIKHVSTQKVISICSNNGDYIRSQVIVKDPNYTEDELWCWESNYLKNKKTGLVLDIRKGKLRLIEDTEICLYNQKPLDKAKNQLWAVQTDITVINEYPHPLSEKTSFFEVIIYSLYNSDWVLDISPDDDTKLVLFPYHPDQQQRWYFMPEKETLHPTKEPHLLFNNESISSDLLLVEEYYHYPRSYSNSSISTLEDYNITNFAYGLTPAKRRNSSFSNRKGI
ncbi:uncharacterized protein BX663DRAFT_520994 [Cokeromyces recurvatus]|uniref:uncharacterized protein n=1 Tax=Cokeromyces recurvatus TaxID=90255 RepID=UPI00222016A0|nr:uncharacterized protein BX663DRAFT_520994 [Cokeromyces recurvatus]KAI7899464.1 hypothetical protein BX663DRAFT_520994 [Cokeromyces recurvatus]